MELEGVTLPQIVTVGAFLLALIGLQLFVVKNKGRFSNSWKSSKRIRVLEEKALSATEKLRIISVDSKQFLLISNKGERSDLHPIEVPKQITTKKNGYQSHRLSKQASNSLLKATKNSLEPTIKKATSETKTQSHELSKAIRAAREMNPGVNYK